MVCGTLCHKPSPNLYFPPASEGGRGMAKCEIVKLPTPDYIPALLRAGLTWPKPHRWRAPFPRLASHHPIARRFCRSCPPDKSPAWPKIQNAPSWPGSKRVGHSRASNAPARHTVSPAHPRWAPPLGRSFKSASKIRRFQAGLRRLPRLGSAWTHSRAKSTEPAAARRRPAFQVSWKILSLVFFILLIIITVSGWRNVQPGTHKHPVPEGG
jgi:hypothetical protein